MDIYDLAVEHFMEATKEETFQAWNKPSTHRFGYLFSHATPDGKPHHHYGCPSQVVGGNYIANDDGGHLRHMIRDKYHSIVSPLKNDEVCEGDIHKYAAIQQLFDTLNPGRYEALTKWAQDHAQEISEFDTYLETRKGVVG